MRTTTNASYDDTTNEAHGRHRRRTHRPPHTNTCPHSLAVKAGLDQDVRLGVLEPVPVGEPVTWCHRMVVCAQKNGEPRRTFDFQALNAHATRESHHTPSPFHQARSVPQGNKKTVFDAWNGYHSVPSCDHIYNTLGKVPIQNRTSMLYCFG